MLTDNARGAIFMMLAMAAFTINDTFMKLLSAEIPLFQALFIRGIASVAAFLCLSGWMGGLRFDFGRRDWILIGLRTTGEVGAAYFFLTALFNMPLANVTAVLQALPLTVTLAAALFLAEPVGWKRLTAILVGFLGVMLIIRPGPDGFNIYALMALASVACVTLRDLATRRLSDRVPSIVVALCAGIGVTASAGIASLWVPWAMPSAAGLGFLSGAAVFVVAGYILSVTAVRAGDLGFVSPFRYTGLLWALVLGLLIFGDWPDGLTLMGAAIIVTTGLFTLFRERATGRRKASALRDPS
ncbi:DMT family transporter [Plastorhodobacter daqingensis]|uniref:DMT family transporter n=1 Tax=Plastorhodobacter daqingensis TaxID=1387281 RepID=A0ABW2UEE4_9RHOB